MQEAKQHQDRDRNQEPKASRSGKRETVEMPLTAVVSELQDEYQTFCRTQIAGEAAIANLAVHSGVGNSSPSL